MHFATVCEWKSQLFYILHEPSEGPSGKQATGTQAWESSVERRQQVGQVPRGCRCSVPVGLGKLPHHPLRFPACWSYRTSYCQPLLLASSHPIGPQFETMQKIKLNPNSNCQLRLMSTLVPSAVDRRWPCVTQPQPSMPLSHP